MAYLEPSQTSKMGLSEKIVDAWKPLTIFAKSSILDSSILDVRLGSKVAFVYRTRF